MLTEEQKQIAEIVNRIRQEHIKTASGTEAIKFEEAVNRVYPFATNVIPLEQECRTQG